MLPGGVAALRGQDGGLDAQEGQGSVLLAVNTRVANTLLVDSSLG